MRTDGERNWLYDTRYGVDRLLAVVGWVKRMMHGRGRGAVLRRDVVTYVDMPFTLCTEGEAHPNRPALIVRNCSELTDATPITHRLEYVEFQRTFDSLHLMANSEFWWKEIQL